MYDLINKNRALGLDFFAQNHDKTSKYFSIIDEKFFISFNYKKQLY